jgi:hypothetical protein
MIRNRSFLLVLALALILEGLAGGIASAQVATGTPPFGSFSGGPEIINNANLNAHWTTPVLDKPGRGTNFTYDLSYDSSVWYPVGSSGHQSWQPVANWGWAGVTQVTTGQISYSLTNVTSNQVYCGPGVGYVTNYVYTYGNWAYMDRFGLWHTFAGSTQIYSPMGCNLNSSSGTSFGATATDGSGYQISAYENCPTSTSCFAISSDGTMYYPPLASSSGVKADRNGNEISIDGSGHITDTLGTTALTVSGSGTASSPMVFSYTPPNTTSSRCSSTNTAGVACYAMSYTNYTVATNFGVSGISEYRSSAAVPLVTSIVLPDNSQYSFSYEATPGTCSPYPNTTCVTGRLASVTLPTGGTISYAYYNNGSNNFTACTTGNNGIFSDGSASCLQRTTPDGTWTYVRTLGTGTASTNLITDPPGNQTSLNFQGIYETQRQAYSGTTTSGTLLRQWTTCYNGNTSNCNSTAITLPITQRNVNDQYGSSGLQAQHNYFYNSVGGLKELDDYDYGSGSAGSLLRKMIVAYASLGNITAFQQTVTICNGTGSSSSCAGPSGGNTGTVVAQTNYNYDEANTLTTTSGIAQHTSVSGSRGNLTSVNYPVSGLTSHLTYYDTGSLNTSKDVNGATTTYNYSSNTADCQMAFPTSVSAPLSISGSMTWNCTGGVLTSLTASASPMAVKPLGLTTAQQASLRLPR